LKKSLAFTISISLILTSVIVVTASTPSYNDFFSKSEIYFTLVAKTNSGGVRPDYLLILKSQLTRIGINLDVIIQDWPTFVGELIAFRNFDLCYVALTGGGLDPDFTGVYNENGSLNLFGYHTDMDYDAALGTGKNEWYMRQGLLIMPPGSAERVNHYWDWEQYLMDKILPCQPTFMPQNYMANWANLNGYNFTDGLLQSWGKMSWTGTHAGQASTSEIVIADAPWTNVNPLFQTDTSSKFINDATMDPLIYYDEDLSVWPHLAESYTMLNDTTLEIVAREGIKWADDPDGLFLDEYFSIEDVFFTFFAWKYLSNDQQWIEDMVMDKAQNKLTIYIDGDPGTPENEPYAPFLPAIARNILPEHYLNQTQVVTGSPDVTHLSWNTFATYSFGTGLFEMDAFTEGVETVLSVRNDCWRSNIAITSDPDLNWVARFGDYTGGLDTLRIRIIPDTATSLLEFEAGKVDIQSVTGSPDNRNDYILNPDFDVQHTITSYFGFFGYNMRQVRPVIGNWDPCPGDPTITKGLAIRKAVSYAMNRVEMNTIVHDGDYVLTDHPIYLKMGIWCNPNIIRYNHDLTKATEYMQLAGYGSDPVINTTTPTTSFTPPTIITPGFTLIISIFSAVSLMVFVFVAKHKKNNK